MKSIIKSVKIRYNVVTVTTKSNVVRHYTLKSNEIARQYYNDLMSWQLVTLRVCGILETNYYQLNNVYTFTM